MSDLPLKATLKAGAGFDAPWLTVDATDPHDLATKLQSLGQAGVHEALVEAANLLKAANNAAPLASGGQEAQAPQQPQGWGQPQQQVPAPSNGGAQQHPEGKQCQQCGTVLQFKQVNRKSDGKTFKFWACPNQKSRNDGHTSEFAN